MMKEICATLLTLCSTLLQSFDFEYSTNKQELFVQGIAECTIAVNTSIPPENRVPVLISTAQAILESNWGESRFAQEANNFYGIIETDKTEPHLKSLNSDVLIKMYGRKCESVYDYVYLLNNGSNFEKFREERIKQVFFTRYVDYDKLIYALEGYATDPLYGEKLREIIVILRKKYFGGI
jgi:flagellum-specific peptidoglycan hydrolase FlgJ